MASVTERRRADGSVGYFAQVRAFRHGKLAHTESKTFNRRRDAEDWGRRREAEIKAMPGDLRRLKVRGRTLRDAIGRYITESMRDLGRTKRQVLSTICTFDIADTVCADVTSVEIVAFARELAAERDPATVQNYLSHLAAVFAVAEPAWGYPLAAAEIKAAQVVCRRLGLTARSTSRDRRVTVAEMDMLMARFADAEVRRPAMIPMRAIMAIALFSTRRQAELTTMRWADLDIEGARVMVRDMKHPGEKIGNNVWCSLPPPALDLIRAVPRTDARILPFNPQTISSHFTRSCKVLGINDLKFHDLRHEGVSRLFEMGMTIPQAAQVSGHRSWSSLQRYAHLRQTGDKWQDWPWIGRLSAD